MEVNDVKDWAQSRKLCEWRIFSKLPDAISIAFLWNKTLAQDPKEISTPEELAKQCTNCPERWTCEKTTRARIKAILMELTPAPIT